MYKYKELGPLPKSNLSRHLIALTLGLSAALPYSNNADAALSVLSRANCAWGVNESVTWDPYSYNWLWTDSYHYYNGTYQHLVRSGWLYSWRSRAGHDFEGSSGWFVAGVHYRWTSSIGTYWLGSTTAYGCNPLSW